MKPDFFRKLQSGFTLLELIVVIGIVSILGTTSVLVLNPAQIFKQTRDANRITDIQNINQSLIYFQAAGGSSFGSTNTIYVSLPDSSATCANLGLPTPPSGWSYACQPEASYQNADGTGWIPVNFSAVQQTVGTLFTALPIDPVNTLLGDYYYTYIVGSWTLSATIESEKYLATSAAYDGGCIDTRFEVGNDLALNCNVTSGGGLSSAKAITAFSFASPAATGVITGTNIAVTVPNGTNVTALVPTITISALASVSPLSGAAQDFTSPVTYTVTAENGSTQAYVVTVTVSPSPLSAPQNLTATPRTNMMDLAWQAPAGTGGSAITNYKIYRGTSSGGETLLTTVGNVLVYTDANLVSGTTYYYRVLAVNASASESDMSNEVFSGWSGSRAFVTSGNMSGGSITGAYAADSYCQVSADAAGLGGTWIAWISDAFNSPASRFTQVIAPYYLVTGTALANNWSDLIDGVLLTPLGITETGSVRNTSYVWTSTLEIGTVSNYMCSTGGYGTIGYSGNVNYAWSHVVFGYGDYVSCGGNYPVYCFEQPLHVSYPKNLTASASDSQVVLDWTSPDYVGGSAITNYKIYRGTSSGGETLLNTVGNVLTYTDSSAVNGTVYYYKVSAVNSASKEGDLSLEVSAIPGFLASIPQNPSATAAGIQIDLQWQAPASSGSGAVTNYKIYRGSSSGAETLLTTIGNVLAYSDANLPTGTRYYYKIAAVNVVGTGALSSEVTALTHTWQDVAGSGNYNESCGSWLTRTGQMGLGSPYTRVMDSADGINYVPSYTSRCTYHADPFSGVGSISPYTTADPTMYPISGGAGFGLYSKTQSLR